MKFALLNLCPQVDEATMRHIEAAAQIFAAQVCSEWERSPCEVTYMPGLKDAPAGFFPLGVFQHPDVAGVEGYHDVDKLGRAYGRAFLDMVKELLHDPSGEGCSLAGVLLHELAETIMDMLASYFSIGPFIDPATGISYPEVAIELCDPVQETGLTITLSDSTIVDGSNYVLEQWFNAHAPAGTRFDHAGVLLKPLTLAPGGYVITRRPGSDSQDEVFGRREVPTPVIQKVTHHERPPAAWRARLQTHVAGRSWRREARHLRVHGRTTATEG